MLKFRSTQHINSLALNGKLMLSVKHLSDEDGIRILNNQLKYLFKEISDILNKQCAKAEDSAINFLSIICSTCVTEFLSSANALQYRLSAFVNDKLTTVVMSMLPVNESTLCEKCNKDFTLSMCDAFNSREKKSRLKIFENFCKSKNVITCENVAKADCSVESVIRIINAVADFMSKAKLMQSRFLELKGFVSTYNDSEVHESVKSLVKHMVSMFSILYKLKARLNFIKLKKLQDKAPLTLKRAGCVKMSRTLTLSLPNKKKPTLRLSHSFSEGQKLFPINEEDSIFTDSVIQQGRVRSAAVTESSSIKCKSDAVEASTSQQCKKSDITYADSKKGSLLNSSNGDSQHDVVYDPLSDIVLYKIDEHSIKNCLMSELGRDMLMRILILEVGNKSELIKILSSEISISELKVIFPRMFLSYSMDNLSSMRPDLVVKRKNGTPINGAFCQEVNSTVQAFLSYMNKIRNDSVTKANISGVGNISVVERKKIFERSDISYTSTKNLVKDASVNTEPISLQLLNVSNEKLMNQEVSTAGEEENLYSSIDDMYDKDDPKSHHYCTIRDCDISGDQDNAPKGFVIAQDNERHSDNPLYDYDITMRQYYVHQSLDTIQANGGIVHNNPMFRSSTSCKLSDSASTDNYVQHVSVVANGIVSGNEMVHSKGVVSIDEKQDTQKSDTSAHKEVVSYDIVKPQVINVVEERRGDILTAGGIGNCILPNRISMDVNEFTIKQHMASKNRDKLFKLLIDEIGNVDKLIKILVLEIGKDALMHVFPHLSLSYIESSLNKASNDSILRNRGLLLKYHEQGGIVVTHLLTALISYVKKNGETLGLPVIGSKSLVTGGSVIEESSVVVQDTSPKNFEESCYNTVLHISEELPQDKKSDLSKVVGVVGDSQSTSNASVEQPSMKNDSSIIVGVASSNLEDENYDKVRTLPIAIDCSTSIDDANDLRHSTSNVAKFPCFNSSVSKNDLGNEGYVKMRNSTISYNPSVNNLRERRRLMDEKRQGLVYDSVDCQYLSGARPKEKFVVNSSSGNTTTSTDQESIASVGEGSYVNIFEHFYSDIRDSPFIDEVSSSQERGKKVRKSASMSAVESSNGCKYEKPHNKSNVKAIKDFILGKKYDHEIFNGTVLKYFVGNLFDSLHLKNRNLSFTDEMRSFKDRYILLNWIMKCIQDNPDICECINAIIRDFSPCLDYYKSVLSMPDQRNLHVYVEGLKGINDVFDYVKMIHSLLHTGREENTLFINVSRTLVKKEVQKYMDRINVVQVNKLKRFFEVFNSRCISQDDLGRFLIKHCLIISSYSFSGAGNGYGLDLRDYANVIIIGDVYKNVTLHSKNITVYGNIKGRILSSNKVKIFGSIEARAEIVHKGENLDSELIIVGHILQFASISISNGVLDIHGEIRGNVYSTKAGVIIKGDTLVGSRIDCREGMYLYVHSAVNNGSFNLKGMQYVFFDKSVTIKTLDALNCEFYLKENAVFSSQSFNHKYCKFHYHIDKKFKRFDIPKFKVLMRDKFIKKGETATGRLETSDDVIHSSLDDLSSIKNVRTGKDVTLDCGHRKDLRISKLSDLISI